MSVGIQLTKLTAEDLYFAKLKLDKKGQMLRGDERARGVNL